MKPETALKALVAFIGVYHLLIGAGLMFSQTFQHFAVDTYGASFEWTVRDTYFIRIVGSFVFVLGSLALAASFDPLRYALFLVCYVEFFVLRDVHRHLYSAELYEGFNVSPEVNVATSVVFAVQAVALGCAGLALQVRPALIGGRRHAVHPDPPRQEDRQDAPVHRDLHRVGVDLKQQRRQAPPEPRWARRHRRRESSVQIPIRGRPYPMRDGSSSQTRERALRKWSKTVTMDRQAAYRLAQQELEDLKDEPLEALLDRLDQARSAHVSDAGHRFLVESTVSWAVPKRTLRLAVTVDAASPQRFERVEESALLACPDEGMQANVE